MQPDQQQGQAPGWNFVAEDRPAVSNNETPKPEQSSYAWSASEFIAYHKNASWYILAIFATLGIGGVVFLITRDIISTVSVAIFGILFMIYAGRKPRVLQYSIDAKGIHIGEKTYPFGLMRSFAVINQGSLRSINLYPLKRFMPPISIYFEPQEESTIVDLLGNHLPHEEKNQDMVDRLMHKIRF